MFGSLFGAQKSPSAFMSPPGMTPQQFAMMLAMQNQGTNQGPMQQGVGAPALPQPGTPAGTGQMPPPPNQNMQNMLPGAGANPSALMQQLMQLDPARLKALLSQYGVPAGGAAVPTQTPTPTPPGQ